MTVMMHCITVVYMATTELLTSTQAGAILGKSSRTVLRLAESGHLPYLGKLHGPNGHYIFRRSDVLRYAADSAQTPA